jgi:hypothetical protein
MCSKRTAVAADKVSVPMDGTYQEDLLTSATPEVSENN